MSTMVPLYGFGGGSGGTGAALTVNAPAGVTVTVSKDGKSKNKTANSLGIAVFKGLSTGEWTVTITDGEKTASKPVTIIADFNTKITLFSATIHVTYPAGSKCTATDGVTTIHAPDDSGTWDCVVPNAGTWTVSLESGLSETIDVTTSGETYTIDLIVFLYQEGKKYVEFAESGDGPKHNISWNNDSIGLNVKTAVDHGSAYACVYTEEQDLISNKKLIVKYKDTYGSATKYTNLVVGVTDGVPNIAINTNETVISNVIATTEKTLNSAAETGEIELDISAINGTGVLFVLLVNNSKAYNGAKSSTAKITEMGIR